MATRLACGMANSFGVAFHYPLLEDQMPEELGTRDVLQHVDAHPSALEQTTIGLRGEVAGLRSEMNSRFDRVYQGMGNLHVGLRTEMNHRFDHVNRDW